MPKIDTGLGVYKYKEVPLYLGKSKINREISRENLLLLKEKLEEEKIEFGLIFGTLLGAVRDKNFIAHDEDTDLYILEEEKEKLFNCLFKLRSAGFEVIRYEEVGLLSIIRKGEYIDFYIFKKDLEKRKCGEITIPSNYLEIFSTISFLEATFKTPKNYKIWLEEWYGKSWNIPIKRVYSKKQIFIGKIKANIKIMIPKKLLKILQTTSKVKENDDYYR